MARTIAESGAPRYSESMPELPEVETTRRGLAMRLEGRRIARIEARRADLRFPLPKDFAKSIQGRRVEALERRAKYILIRLEGGLVWLIHLGMSGRMVLRSGWPNDIGAHDHVIFATDEGWAVTFNDARRFGMMDLIPEAELARHNEPVPRRLTKANCDPHALAPGLDPFGECRPHRLVGRQALRFGGRRQHQRHHCQHGEP